MSEHERQQDGDLVNKAVAAARQSPIPEGPRPELAERTLAAVSARAGRPKSKLLQSIYGLPWKSKAAAVLGIAASGLVIYAAVQSLTQGSIAFAQVAEKLASAQSVSFEMTVEPLQKTFPVIKAKVSFLGSDKMRAETRIPQTDQIMILISDQTAGKTVVLNSAAKVAVVGVLKGGEETPEESFAARFRKLSKKASRSLGQKVIDGVEATGFEVEKESVTMQVWADSKTGNPVRMEGEFPYPQPIGKSKVLISNFKLDEPMDPSLFSVEVPKDYTVIKSPFEIDLSITPAQLVTTILRVYANLCEGQFPAKLNDMAQSIDAELKKKGLKVGEEGESADVTRLRGWTIQLNTLLMGMESGIDYQYYPGGKLGEKNQIVFWCKDKKSGEYTAVYGDLRVEKIGKDKLPPTPENAEKPQ